MTLRHRGRSRPNHGASRNRGNSNTGQTGERVEAEIRDLAATARAGTEARGQSDRRDASHRDAGVDRGALEAEGEEEGRHSVASRRIEFPDELGPQFRGCGRPLLPTQ